MPAVKLEMEVVENSYQLGVPQSPLQLLESKNNRKKKHRAFSN